MYILSTGCDVCGIKKRECGQKKLHKNPTLKCIYRFVTSYLLSVKVTHENEKNKNSRLYMLKHYLCKYTIDRDTL